MTGWSISGGRISCRLFSTDRLSADSRDRENFSAVSRALLTELDRIREAISLTGAPTMTGGRCPQCPPRPGQVYRGRGRDHWQATPDSASTGITPSASFRASRLLPARSRARLDFEPGLPVGLLGLYLRQSVQQGLGARGQGWGLRASSCSLARLVQQVQRGPGTLRSGHRCPPRRHRAWPPGWRPCRTECRWSRWRSGAARLVAAGDRRGHPTGRRARSRRRSSC